MRVALAVALLVAVYLAVHGACSCSLVAEAGMSPPESEQAMALRKW